MEQNIIVNKLQKRVIPTINSGAAEIDNDDGINRDIVRAAVDEFEEDEPIELGAKIISNISFVPPRYDTLQNRVTDCILCHIQSIPPKCRPY